MFAHEFNAMHGPGFGGPRIGRGMMEPIIINALSIKPMHGYEIISSVEERSHGMWRPSAGSVYPTLQLLEEKSLVTVSEEGGKKTYTLTDMGRKEAEKAAHLNELFGGGRGRADGADARGHLYMRRARETFGASMRDMRVIYRKGNDAQRQQLLDEIGRFTSAVHAILGEDDE